MSSWIAQPRLKFIQNYAIQLTIDTGSKKMNALQSFEKKELERLSSGRSIPVFFAGDILKVHVKVMEGEKERMQSFEGVCIARRNRGLGSSVTVRKISFGEGVEKIFPLYSPNIKIEVVRRGVVRRAKLYYLRGRLGKSARIAEDTSFNLKVNENAGAKPSESVEVTIEENNLPE